MKSIIAERLNVQFSPVAIAMTDEKPENALQFKEGKWGCVMFMYANVAKGKTAAFDIATCGCWGGGVGLCFGNTYLGFPGGLEGFAGFLSSGNGGTEEGRNMAAILESAAGKDFSDDYLHGECFKQNPQLVHQWINELPLQENAKKYTVLRPLAEYPDDAEPPAAVSFVVNALQLSALTILANYGREGRENVCIPWAAGCQLIALLPIAEGLSDKPRAVIGLTDLSARKAVRKLLGEDCLTFSMPYQMYQEMERHVQGSFFDRPLLQALLSQSL